MPAAARFVRWDRFETPSTFALTLLLESEGMSSYTWSNAPNELYAPHIHPYHKTIYVIEGAITFILPETGERLTLTPGDRLDLPAGVLHSAVVGPQGVTCLEGHRSFN